MRIPPTTVKPRYYVAVSERHAFSSWDTLDEALACIERFPEGTDREQIRGIVRVDSEGRRWVPQSDDPATTFTVNLTFEEGVDRMAFVRELSRLAKEMGGRITKVSAQFPLVVPPKEQS